MKKVIVALFLSSVFVLGSGFGAVENNSYVRTEAVSAEKAVVKVENSSLEISTLTLNEEFEKVVHLDSSESFSEKVGGLIVESFISVLKSVSAFLLTLIH
ncbi:hypothetical protein [uncultured Arcticibacterium sp.]|uniref:hypothetical protein n=1 Tax=uncultured Arcticibacterium sp. TaxID=2173042 RepID=UPI0030F532B5